MVKPLGLLHPLRPKTPLGFGQYGSSLTFFQPLGRQSLGILNPALFQRQTSSIGLKSWLSQSPGLVQESHHFEATQPLTNQGLPDIQSRVDTASHSAFSSLEGWTSQHEIGDEDTLTFYEEDASTFQADANSVDSAGAPQNSNSNLSITTQAFSAHNSPIQRSLLATPHENLPKNIDLQQNDVSPKQAAVQLPTPETALGTLSQPQPLVPKSELNYESRASLSTVSDSASPDLSANTNLAHTDQAHVSPPSFPSPLSKQDASQTSTFLDPQGSEVPAKPLAPFSQSNPSKTTAKANPESPKIQNDAIDTGITSGPPQPLQVETISSENEGKTIPSSAHQGPNILENCSEVHVQKRGNPEFSSAEMPSSESNLPRSPQIETEAQTAISPTTVSSPSSNAPHSPVSTPEDANLLAVEGPLEHQAQSPSRSLFGEGASPTHTPNVSDSFHTTQSPRSNAENPLARQVDSAAKTEPTPATDAKVRQEIQAGSDRPTTALGLSKNRLLLPQNSLANSSSDIPSSSSENGLEEHIANSHQTDSLKTSFLNDQEIEASLNKTSLTSSAPTTIQRFKAPLQGPTSAKRINVPELPKVLKPIGILESLGSHLSTQPLISTPQGIAQTLLSAQQQSLVSLVSLPRRSDVSNDRNYRGSVSSPLPSHPLPRERGRSEQTVNAYSPHMPTSDNTWPATHPAIGGTSLSDGRLPLMELASSTTPATLPKSLPSQALSQPTPSSANGLARATLEQSPSFEPTVIAPPLNRQPFPDLQPLQPKLASQIVKSSPTPPSSIPQTIERPALRSDTGVGSGGEPSPTASPDAIAKLTTQIYQLVKQRFLIEQERQGRFNQRLG